MGAVPRTALDTVQVTRRVSAPDILRLRLRHEGIDTRVCDPSCRAAQPAESVAYGIVKPTTASGGPSGLIAISLSEEDCMTRFKIVTTTHPCDKLELCIVIRGISHKCARLLPLLLVYSCNFIDKDLPVMASNIWIALPTCGLTKAIACSHGMDIVPGSMTARVKGSRPRLAGA